MKRVASWLLLFLAPLSTAGAAHAVSVGGAAFGGVSIPIVQDDNGTGSQFGIRVPVQFAPLLSVEPYFSHSGLGDATQTFGGFDYTRSGFDVDAFGVNVALGSFGLMPGVYPYVGIGSHELTRTGSDDASEVGYNFGLGFGFEIPPGLSLNLRGELNMIATGDTSRKFVNFNLGVGYKFIPLP
jgi:opacity protein-like surface antigen